MYKCTRLYELYKLTKCTSRNACLLYISDASDEEDSLDLGGPLFIKKKNTDTYPTNHPYSNYKCPYVSQSNYLARSLSNTHTIRQSHSYR